MNKFVPFTFQEVLNRDASSFCDNASDIVACNAIMQHWQRTLFSVVPHLAVFWELSFELGDRSEAQLGGFIVLSVTLGNI
jgi:hypothetical protein